MPEAAGLYYELHGPEGAPPLLLSSGLGGSASYWAPNITALAEQFRVIAYDHRGTGRSDRALPAAVTVEDMADDLLAVMDAAGVDRANLVGHAAGAVAALALAIRRPDRIRTLTMVNGWSYPDPHFLRCFDVRLALLRDSGPLAYLRAQPLFLYPPDWMSDHAERLAAEDASHLAHFAGADVYEKRIAALALFDMDARLGEVVVPVLLVAAADDMLVPPKCSRHLASRIPGARLEPIPWGGHACNVTDPVRFNALVLDFLRS